MSKFTKLILSVAALTFIALPAQAYEKGDWLLRVGGGMVDPKSDNSTIVSVDSGSTLIFNGTYFFSPNVGLELLAAFPFSHDIHDPTGAVKLAETEHLPPTLSLQYHFNTDASFRPYVGAGLNFTTFFDEQTTETLNTALGLTSSSLKLDHSFGIAVQLGADIDVSDRMFLNLDIRWIDIDTEASIPEADLNFDVEIDPMVYSIALGWKF